MQIAYYWVELKKAVLRVSLAETRLTVYRQLLIRIARRWSHGDYGTIRKIWVVFLMNVDFFCRLAASCPRITL